MRIERIMTPAMAWVSVAMIVLMVSMVPEAEAGEDPSSSEEYRMYQSILDTLSKTQIHGFLSQGFLWSTGNNYLHANTTQGDFRFNELGINFSFEPAEKLRVGLQLFSRSLGYLGNNDVVLDWAYADYRYKDWLGLRAGILKVTKGVFNEIRDIDQLRTCIILPQSVYEAAARDHETSVLGLAIYGEMIMGSAGSLSYEAYVGTGKLDDDNASIQGVLKAYGFASDNYESQMGITSGGSLDWNTPVDGLRVGGSLKWTEGLLWDGQTTAESFLGAGADFRYMAENFISCTASIEWAVDPVIFIAEFKHMEGPGTISVSSLPVGIDPTLATLTSLFLPYTYDVCRQGFYGLLSYRLTDVWEVGVYYSMLWPHANNRDGSKASPLSMFPGIRTPADFESWLQDIALSTRYDIFPSWSVKLEGHYMNGAAGVLPQDNPGGLKENWFFGAVKTSFTF